METNSNDNLVILQEVLKIINTNLNVICTENDLVYVRKLGRTSAKQPVLLKFESERKRNDILFKRAHLKGSNLFLMEDYPKDIREERKILNKFYKQAREENRDVKFGYNYLVLNGKRVYCENLLNGGTAKSKKRSTPRRGAVRRRTSARDSDDAVIPTEDSSRPSTPLGTQLEQWLGTTERKKTQQVLKKKKTSSCESAVE